jgi:hypothetical protein
MDGALRRPRRAERRNVWRDSHAARNHIGMCGTGRLLFTLEGQLKGR